MLIGIVFTLWFKNNDGLKKILNLLNMNRLFFAPIKCKSTQSKNTIFIEMIYMQNSKDI